MKRLLALGLALVFSVTSSLASPLIASIKKSKNLSAEATKELVKQLGADSKQRVSVKLKNGKAHTGYITEIADDYYVIADAKTSITSRVPYGDTVQIATPSNKSRLITILVIGAALAVVAVVVAGSTK